LSSILTAIGTTLSISSLVLIFERFTLARLQTAVLKNEIEWEEFPYIKDCFIPKKEFINKIFDGYYEKYSVENIDNKDIYFNPLKDRFQQRVDYISNSDIQNKQELMKNLATRYLNILEKEQKITQIGTKGRSVKYVKKQ